MSPIQVLVIIFGIFALFSAIRKFRKGRISGKEFVFWAMVWIVLIIISILPRVTTFFANLFNIGRGADVVLYTSVIVLFYIVFLLYSKIEKTERGLTKLIRNMAIEKRKLKGVKK